MSPVTPSHPDLPLPPGSMLGVLGGGQLARMFAMAAHRLGYRVTTLDSDPHCPAGGASDRHLCAKLDDPLALADMAQTCAAITIETENVPQASLAWLAERVRVAPDARALSVANDRLKEKAFCLAQGIAVAPHARIDDATQLDTVPEELFPGILKVCRNGYDGKGQAGVRNRRELAKALQDMGGAPCVLEARLRLAAELSVILARSDRGDCMVYPVPLNTHRDGVLESSVIPAPLPQAALQQAQDTALRIAGALDYRGVLCVEFFLLEDGQLLVNEMAPRPHNSGHFSIDACASSQFEQQVRVLAGLPLGDARLLRPAAMVNLLGETWSRGEPSWAKALARPQVHLHLYGKRQARPGRKMGHITALGEDASSLAESLLRLRADIGGARPSDSEPA